MIFWQPSLQYPGNLFHKEGLNNIANLNIIEIFNADTTLKSGLDLFNIIFKTPQG